MCLQKHGTDCPVESYSTTIGHKRKHIRWNYKWKMFEINVDASTSASFIFSSAACAVTSCDVLRFWGLIQARKKKDVLTDHSKPFLCSGFKMSMSKSRREKNITHTLLLIRPKSAGNKAVAHSCHACFQVTFCFILSTWKIFVILCVFFFFGTGKVRQMRRVHNVQMLCNHRWRWKEAEKSHLIIALSRSPSLSLPLSVPSRFAECGLYNQGTVTFCGIKREK